MDKRGIEWLNISIVVMSVVIVLFSAVALTIIYDSYNPSDKSSSKSSSSGTSEVKTANSAGTIQNRGTSTGTSGNTNSGTSGTSGTTTSGNTNSGTKTTTSTFVSCPNDCSPVGAKKCSGNYALYCGDFDGDGCFEWGSSVSCIAGCLNGLCNAGLSLNSELSRCYESNPSHNPLIKGNITDKYGSIGIDSCYNITTLKQYSCASDNSSSVSLVYCQYGCNSGACLSVSQAALNNNANDGTGNASNPVNVPVVDCDQSWATLSAEGNNLNYCTIDGDCRVRNNFNSNCYPLYYNKDSNLTTYNQIIASYPSSCSQSASGCSASVPQYGLTLKCVSGKCQNVINQCKVISDCIPNYCSQSAGCNCTSGVCTQGPYCGNGVCDSGETGDSCESGPVGCAPAGMYTGDTSCLLIKPVSCTYTLKKGSCGVDCGAISSCSGQGSYSLTRCTCYNGKLACVY